MKSFFGGLLAIAVAACSGPANNGPWPTRPAIDLSHDYSEQTVFWPTAEAFRLQKVSDGMTEQGYYYAANNFSTSEHGGTHLDAPVHFAKATGQSIRFHSISSPAPPSSSTLRRRAPINQTIG
jgi:Putative cyclase